MAQLPISSSPPAPPSSSTPTPMQTVSVARQSSVVTPTRPNHVPVSQTLGKPPTTALPSASRVIAPAPGKTASSTPSRSSAPNLPAPLARSMASTATKAPPPPPPPSSLAQTPPFLTKLYNLVEDERTLELVSWTEDESSFTVHKPDEFARDVLPRYFKHNNFSSFVRQLNQYGFHKRDPDRWTFGHDNFRRGRLDLLRLISRRRPKPTVAPPTVQPKVELTMQANGSGQAVVELGNFGLAGKVESLQRDKDVLLKELITTRKNEHALQEKCDNLENRLGLLESSTKQMQNFILHYFSKVLQPYSDEIASRKRKRLPPAAPTSHDLISPTPNIAGGSASTAKARAPAVLPPPTGSSLEALRQMMQQMQMAQPNHGASSMATSGAMRSPPLMELEPAIVQELMHDDTQSAASIGSVEVSVPSSSPPTSQMNGQTRSSTSSSRLGKAAPSMSRDDLWLVPSGTTIEESLANGRSIMAKDSTMSNESSQFGEDGSVSPLWGRAPEKEVKESDGVRPKVEPIDEFIEFTDDLELLPPLTALPEGTDIGVLARQIEGFGDPNDSN